MIANDAARDAPMRDAVPLHATPSSDAVTRNGWVPVFVLACFSFLLHFLWEMLQVPLYADIAGMAHWSGIVVCAKTTAGDVAIALTAYTVAARRARAWHWHASRALIVRYLAVGTVVTVVLDGLNVYVWHRWAYATAMPLVLGIGVSPLVQWVVVPLLALWLMQRHVAGVPRPPFHTPDTHAPSRSHTRI